MSNLGPIGSEFWRFLSIEEKDVYFITNHKHFQVLLLRKSFEKRGLTFYIHIDGAWGGYFATILRTPGPSQVKTFKLFKSFIIFSLAIWWSKPLIFLTYTFLTKFKVWNIKESTEEIAKIGIGKLECECSVPFKFCFPKTYHFVNTGILVSVYTSFNYKGRCI